MNTSSGRTSTCATIACASGARIRAASSCAGPSWPSQRRRDEVLQIAVALLFDPWMVLRTITPYPREVVARLEDVAPHMLNLCGLHTLASLQIQRCFQHRLAMNQGVVFLQDRLRDELERGFLPIHRNRLGEHLLEPLWAYQQSATSGRLVLASLAKK